MAKGSQGSVTYAALGPQIDNGYEMGGSRMYPWSAGLAVSPPAYYSDYIGTGTGLPVSVPAGSLPDTVGTYDQPGVSAAEHQAAAHPFGRTSPLPWVLAGGVAAVLIGHHLHYRERR